MSKVNEHTKDDSATLVSGLSIVDLIHTAKRLKFGLSPELRLPYSAYFFIIIIIIIYLLKKTTYSNRKASEQDRQAQGALTSALINLNSLLIQTSIFSPN